MKITKSQLKQIIKEEIINEIGVPLGQVGGGVPVADPHTAAIDSLVDYIANHYGQDDALRELVENIQDTVLDFEDASFETMRNFNLDRPEAEDRWAALERGVAPE